MRALVTGGAGFIGSNFVRHILAETPVRLVIVDKLTYAGSLESLAGVLDGARVQFVRADIADRAAMERFARVNLGDVAVDHDDEMVAFFTSDWRRRRAEEEWPMLRFHAVREQHGFEAA